MNTTKTFIAAIIMLTLGAYYEQLIDVFAPYFPALLIPFGLAFAAIHGIQTTTDKLDQYPDTLWAMLLTLGPVYAHTVYTNLPPLAGAELPIAILATPLLLFLTVITVTSIAFSISGKSTDEIRHETKQANTDDPYGDKHAQKILNNNDNTQ